jgi:hypothetical protein
MFRSKDSGPYWRPKGGFGAQAPGSGQQFPDNSLTRKSKVISVIQ